VAAVRGFGYLHDGTIGSVEEFLTGVVFLEEDTQITVGGASLGPNPGGLPVFNDPSDPFNAASGISTRGLALRHELASFAFAYDSNMFPVVGQQVTVSHANASASAARVALFESQAAAGDCDLIVRGHLAGRERGFVYSNGAFVQDRSGLPALNDSALQALVSVGATLTFTCVPPGSGWRLGIDRDGDGYADGDELAAGSDPANANSTP
jgi:hypothetical protein